ncbi:MAG: alpha-1,2-fucosyltransferase [Bacillota bacterium]|nr:alpha-1,2-fucosyltransferase [Bacillota bacterium]
MNIIKITGGLGNQMFQYALYLKLKSLGRDVKIDDLTEYEKPDARPNMLWCFDASYEAASRQEIDSLTDGFMNLSHRVRRKLLGRRSLKYSEADCNFDEQVLQRDPAYLTGYFQSEKYFKNIENQVRQAFSFSHRIWEGLDEQLVQRIREYQGKIEGFLSVSVHVRRGDYLNSSEVYGGICTGKYYQKAIELMREKYPQAVFFVFSNDPVWTGEWIKERYGEDKAFVVVEGTDENNGYLDLFLMSKCRHHIIANSSFSWWGAWLNSNREKTVIAPSKWLNNQECRDIYTQEMIKISPCGERVFR